ncbi:MAG: hypothetical protein L0H73_05290 [Nitrococcus sp.]|nr:hypothetical protein [Nitrococcus sp.]
MIRTLIAVLILSGLLVAFTGCQTMGGASEDTQNDGKATESSGNSDGMGGYY